MKIKLLLTDDEQRLISQIAADSESGNHLLRPRSNEYKALYKKFCEIVNKKKEERTDKEKQMCEDYSAFKDFNAHEVVNKKYEVSVDLADTPSIPAMVMYENGKVVKVKTGF